MKKVLALALALVMLLSMAACSKGDDAEESSQQEAAAQVSSTEESSKEEAAPAEPSIVGIWGWEMSLEEFIDQSGWLFHDRSVDEDLLSTITLTPYTFTFNETDEMIGEVKTASIREALEKVVESVPEDERERLSEKVDSLMDNIENEDDNYHVASYSLDGNVLTWTDEDNDTEEYTVVLTADELTIKVGDYDVNLRRLS